MLSAKRALYKCQIFIFCDRLQVLTGNFVGLILKDFDIDVYWLIFAHFMQ